MQLFIKDIATVSSGYYIRGSVGESTINYLQAIDFDDGGEPKSTFIPSLGDNQVQPRQLLEAGDILVTAKGSRTLALLYKKEYGPSVASSTFFVIRTHDPKIIPEYLAIYLNESLKSAYFKNHFSGGTVPSIPKSVLEEYEMTIPTLAKQQTIITLYHQHKQQLTLYDNLKQKKSQFMHTLLLSSTLSLGPK